MEACLSPAGGRGHPSHAADGGRGICLGEGAHLERGHTPVRKMVIASMCVQVFARL